MCCRRRSVVAFLFLFIMSVVMISDLPPLPEESHGLSQRGLRSAGPDRRWDPSAPLQALPLDPHQGAKKKRQHKEPVGKRKHQARGGRIQHRGNGGQHGAGRVQSRGGGGMEQYRE
ncbi:hypothetical protein AAFF_G00402560, partial [Aldrovandia affinis]